MNDQTTGSGVYKPELTYGSWNKLFQNLFWPAAAGSVFWSFCTLIIQATDTDQEFFARLISILLISLYLTMCWILSENLIPKYPRMYWFFELLHIWGISLFAISAQINGSKLSIYLNAVFFITAVGHFFGVWARRDEELKFFSGTRLGKGAICLAGICILMLYPEFSCIWRLPLSIFVVLLLWAIFGEDKVFKILRELAFNKVPRQE